MHGAGRFGMNNTHKRHDGVVTPILAITIFSVIANLLMLVMPVYMTQVYDRILPTRSVETLVALTVIAGGALLVFGVIETVRQTLARRLAQRYELSVLPRLIAATDDAAGGTDPALVGKVGVLKRFIGSSAFIGLFDLPFAPLFLGLMFLAHPVLGWLTAAGMLMLVLVALLNEWASRKASLFALQAQTKAARSAQEALAAQEDVRSMGMGVAMRERWLGDALIAADHADRAGQVNARFFGLTRFVRQALQIAALGLGAWLVVHGDMAASLIFAATIVSARALMPIEQVVGGWKAIVEARRAKMDVDAALAAQAIGDRVGSKTELPPARGELSAHRLTFRLGSGAQQAAIVNGVDLVARPGSLTVIVGASGSGKSTLLRLFCGASQPSFGEVRLDGFRLGEWPAASRGKAFGYMAQQISLFEGTVAQNIARFDAAATDASIIKAAERAQAHDFIASLPQGYNTRIGQGGVRLSGGQVQRIALARALHTDPAVLILDEPNAHLDSHGEEALMKALLCERDNGHTIIVATHRTNLLSIADTVLLMEAGTLKPVQVQPAGRAAPRGQVLSIAGAAVVASTTDPAMGA